MKQGKKKPSCLVRLIMGILALIIGVCIAVMFLNLMPNTEQPENTENIQEQEEAVLVEGEVGKISFQKTFEAPGAEGVFYLQMKMENKTNRTVWVVLDSVSVDDRMVTAMSGVPTIIEPGKYSENPFILSGEMENVHSISFDIVYMDNETNEEIFRSENITVDLKK